jgi:hypothetical protein
MIYQSSGLTYNIYCDESCHLEYDQQPVMVLGAIWCPLDKNREIAMRIRDIKQNHGLPPNFEIKWTKVSPAKIKFYMELLDYFFDDDDLHFRALIVLDKQKLNHERRNQTHDEWYYKMYFDMLKTIISPHDIYRIYLDIKDTRGGEKIRKLHEVLCNNMYDFSREVIERIQIIRSCEVEIMQLVDLITGIISSVNREVTKSEAKQALIKRMRQRSGYLLKKTTLYREMKVNLFFWHPERGL